MIEWFSAPELAGLPKYPNKVHQLAKKENWRSKEKSKGKGLEYELYSLPEETRVALLIKYDQQEKVLKYDRETLWTNSENKTQKALHKSR